EGRGALRPPIVRVRRGRGERASALNLSTPARVAGAGAGGGRSFGDRRNLLTIGAGCYDPPAFAPGAGMGPLWAGGGWPNPDSRHPSRPIARGLGSYSRRNGGRARARLDCHENGGGELPSFAKSSIFIATRCRHVGEMIGSFWRTS